MPTIDLTDGTGRIRHDFIARALAVMLYPAPAESDARHGFLARCTAELAARGMAVPLDAATLQVALAADHHPFGPRGDTRPWNRGVLAGTQMAWLWSLAHSGVDGASLRKARYLTECWLTAQNKPGGQKVLADAWRSHGPVSHLFAAWVLRDQMLQRFAYLPDAPPMPGWADFLRFLWEAEQISRFAAGFQPNAKARLFDGRVELWTLPGDMPALTWHPGWPPLGVSTFAITPEVERLLSRYRDGAPLKKPGRPRKRAVV